MTDVEETEKKGGRKGVKSFALIPDKTGALINSGLFLLYIVVCLVLASRTEGNSVWFYLLYFLACFVTFQAVTVVGRHCLHLTPKSVTGIELAGKKLLLFRKNGNRDELTRNVDYARKSKILIIEGVTHDGQKASEVIRKGAMMDDEFDKLIIALKRFR